MKCSHLQEMPGAKGVGRGSERGIEVSDYEVFKVWFGVYFLFPWKLHKGVKAMCGGFHAACRCPWPLAVRLPARRGSSRAAAVLSSRRLPGWLASLARRGLGRGAAQLPRSSAGRRCRRRQPAVCAESCEAGGTAASAWSATRFSLSPSLASAKAWQLEILRAPRCLDGAAVGWAVGFSLALCPNVVDMRAGEKHHVRAARVPSRSGVPAGRTPSAEPRGRARRCPLRTPRAPLALPGVRVPRSVGGQPPWSVPRELGSGSHG